MDNTKVNCQMHSESKCPAIGVFTSICVNKENNKKMKTYKTIDGLKKLISIGNGLLHDPITFISYEQRLCKEVFKNIKHEKSSFIVSYWTDRDYKIGSCCPTGRTEISFYSDHRNPVSMIENRKKFKNRIYDIEQTL